MRKFAKEQKGFEITNYYLRNEHFNSYAVTHAGYKVFVSMTTHLLQGFVGL